ncbi:O-antigen ligase family protein [Enterovibrio calviensis]|uniref:O-antigen ligase family protein n=1 Tax=Enterovibrio calviensis TaxID=91359 RepID=UPI00138E2AE3|nr:O-antigen ligase family protein [Enterovibrio calviensis]
MSVGFHVLSIVLIPIFPELTIMQFWGLEEIGGQRITGLSGSANSYGQMAGLAIIITQYLRKTLVIKNSTYIMSILFFTACLLASWSRTSIFITFIGFLFIEKELFNRYKYSALAALVFCAVSYFAIFDIDDLLLSFSRNGSVNEIFTFTGRTGIWEAVWNESLNNPVFGHGYASTKLLLPTIFETDWGWSTVTAHNMFLQSFFTTGSIGIALLSITLLIFFKACLKLNNGLLNYFLFLTIVNGLLESGAVGPIPNKLTFIFFLFFMKSIDIHLRSIRESER